LVPSSGPELPAVEWNSWRGRGIGVPTNPFERPLSAVRRHKWLIAAVMVLAVAAGLAGTKLITPEYEVRATIWIQSETPIGDRSGPIRSQELLNSGAWVELLKSYRIADAVVRSLSLYVATEKPGEDRLFSNFDIGDKHLLGKFRLDIDRAAKTWRLAQEGTTYKETGAMSDSVGVTAGFRWKIPPEMFEGSGKQRVNFTISTPRETSILLMKRLNARLPEKSNFLWLTYRASDPQLAQRTLNAWANEFVNVAGELKKRNVVQFATILEGQLNYAETSLHDAERSLEDFRIQTITLPAEGGPVAAGVEMTRDPAFKSFFEQKIQYDNVRHDREALQKVIAGAAAGTVPWEAALLIPSVAQSLGAENLRDAFNQLRAKQTELATKRETLTDQHPVVRELVASVQTLETQTIPRFASQLEIELKGREDESSRRISGASEELKAIPSRTIEEMRLRRSVAVSEALYTTLKTRYSEAQLAAASTAPDVYMLDSAIAPLQPTNNTAPKLLLMSILGGLGLAIGLALLLDAFDHKIRYPEQVTDELGLSIAGALRQFPKGGVNTRSPEETSQLVESIRSVRMHVQHSANVPISVAVSSPSPGDGKSFLSANLAMSFSDAGFRTVLVDADTRRGALHELFEVSAKPGLTDYLSRTADLSSILRPTQHEKLSVIPRGKLQTNSPELLTSPTLAAFAAQLRRDYDVVVFDTPPLAAGIDAYAVAASAQNLLLVFRIGKTERRMAAAKLELMDRLPVRVLGAVLNCVELRGEYVYYKYAAGYGTTSEEPNALVSG
jgi:succinoglycan biosynthesis transport protein ExoP